MSSCNSSILGNSKLAPRRLTQPEPEPYIRGMHAPTADLDARSRKWAATNDPASLWPGLDLALLHGAALGIERSVAQILAGRTTSLGGADGGDAHVIGVASLLSGTGPLLGYWVERGMLDVSAPLACVLARHLAHGRSRYTRIHREVMPALESLVRAGVAPAILKGFHTTNVYFPEPGVRPLADVDVYVVPELVARAEQALASADFHLGVNSARFKSDWYPGGEVRRIRSLEFWHSRSPWKVELHSALEFGTLIRHGVQLESAMAVTEPWNALGIPLRVAPQPLLFVALAAHLSGELHSSRLLRLVELTFLIRRDSASGSLDWAHATDLLERTGAERFAYPALTLVEQLAPGTVDPALLALTVRRSTRIARVVVGELTPATPILHEQVSFAERLMWEPGIIGVVRRVVEMFLPARGVSLAEILFVYRSRVRRLLTGRVSWRQRGRRGASGEMHV